MTMTSSSASKPEEEDVHVPDSKMIFKKFLSGGLVAAVAVTLTAPLDRAKLILQTQQMSSFTPKERQYKGVMDILSRIPREQGILAFWRGNTASIIRCFPYAALNFTLRDVFRGYLYEKIHPKEFKTRMFLNLLAGGLAGSAALLVIYPLDYARTRLALDDGSGSSREYKNMRHCLIDAYKVSGIRGIYRGTCISIFGVFIYRAAFFGIYDTGVEGFPPDLHNAWMHFLLAEASSLTAGMTSYPIDTVRRCMMMQVGSNPKGRAYKSSWECMTHIYQQNGIKGFFRGNMVNLLRSTGGSIMLILYDYINVYILGEVRKSHTVPKNESNQKEVVKDTSISKITKDTKSTDDKNRVSTSSDKSSCSFCSF